MIKDKPELSGPELSGPELSGSLDAEPFAVYVHWPFCLAKCPYCDFNSHVSRATPDYQGIVTALCQEISWCYDHHPHGQVSSIYFGGGTPSLMPPWTVAAIISAIGQNWHLAKDVEITLEANPTSSEATRFAGYKAAGVNRLSIGVQSLDDHALKMLGRQHTAKEAMAVVAMAQKIFNRVSFDLIYARPKQTLASWRYELTQALTYGVDHMSLYQLTIEPGTRFFDLHKRGKLAIPNQDIAADFYMLTNEICGNYDLDAYEISNYSRPGYESRHNLIYWRGYPFAGVGPGAHGRLGLFGSRMAIMAEKMPDIWQAAVIDNGHGYIDRYMLSQAEQADELLLMGLRLREGLDTRRYQKLKQSGIDVDRCASLADKGLIEPDYKDRLKTTAAGALVLNSVILELA